MSLSRDEMLAFISEGHPIGRIATASADGAPHVVPVWFAVEDGRILIHSLAAARKVRHVRENPRAGFVIDRDTHPYRGVSIQGAARIAPEGEIDWDGLIRRLARDYCPPEMAEGFGAYLAGIPGEHVVIVIEPETWEHWDYA